MAETSDSQNAINDATGTVDLDPAVALEKVDAWLDGLIRVLPNVVVAIVVLVIFYFVAAMVYRVFYGAAKKRGRENLGEVLGGFIKWVVFALGVLLAITIVLPSVKPGDLIAGLGVSSVAIGFAFKDILQNWLAGLLLLIRQPFEVGDQIISQGHEGTVERIETRATLLKTYDGCRVVIPNSEIYTDSVIVNTAFEKRRSQYDIGIGYGDDMHDAIDIMVNEAKQIDEILDDPAPEAMVWDLAASWVTIRVRWWTNSERADVVRARTRLLPAVKAALDDAGIDMPYPTEVQLFHDQSEEVDGDRSKQREGWPAPAHSARENSPEDLPSSRWKADRADNRPSSNAP